MMAMAARARGPCCVKWYPKRTTEGHCSSIVAISISTVSPRRWHCGAAVPWDEVGFGDPPTLPVPVAARSHLVVHLELAQGAVLVHGLDDAHHASAGDEVGLNVEALQRFVLCQHLGHGLQDARVTSRCHPGVPPHLPRAAFPLWGWGGCGEGLTVATGSLLRVATRLSFLTWVLVFMASQMAFSVEMGMSCSKGTWLSPRGGDGP